MRGLTRAACILVALASEPGMAAAQPSPPSSPPSSPPPSPPSSPQARQEAVEKFERAQELYQQGEFEEAVALLLELRAIRKEPVLLYNLARAYEGLGAIEEALDAYEGYLQEAPDAADRGAIEKRVETLKEQRAKLRAEQRPVAPAPEPAPAPVPVAEPSPSLIALPITLTSLGLVGLGVGVGLGVVSQNRKDDAASASSQVDAQSLHDEAGTLATSANVMFVVGGVLAAAGATWLVVELATDEADGTQATLGPAGLRVAF